MEKVRRIQVVKPDTGFLQFVAEHQTHFRDPVDTWLLRKGISFASQLAGRISVPKTLLDLGTGVSISPSFALKDKEISSAMGIEINPQAAEQAIALAQTLGVKNNIITGSLFDQNVHQKSIAFSPSIISGNLPYLPANPNTDPAVNGGEDGTKFIETLFDFATEANAPIVSMNMCSMTTPQKVLEIIQNHGYEIETVLALKDPFGEYTTKLVSEGVIKKGSGQIYYQDPIIGERSQLIINIILVKHELAKSREIEVLPAEEFMQLLTTFEQSGELPNI